eukprot:scaffold24762_cov107-Isochrysis_galbana.AAC.3
MGKCSYVVLAHTAMEDSAAMPRRGVLPLLPKPVAPPAQATHRGFVPLAGLPKRTGMWQHRTEGWFVPGVDGWCVQEHFEHVLTAAGCKNSSGRCVLHVETEKELVVRSGAPLPLSSHRLKGAHFSEVVVEYSNPENDVRIPKFKSIDAFAGALCSKTVVTDWLSGNTEAVEVALWLTMLPCDEFTLAFRRRMDVHDGVVRLGGRRSGARVSGQLLHANPKIEFYSPWLAKPHP